LATRLRFKLWTWRCRQAKADTGYSYTTISVPGAAYTIPLEINNAGQIVGEYQIPGANLVFVYNNGVYSTISRSWQYSY
jgi:hypothetical protein